MSKDITNTNKVDTNEISIGHYHALLMTVDVTCIQLIFKTLPVFIGYLVIDYKFEYSFIVIALSIGSLFTSTSFIINPLLLNLKTNVAFLIMCLVECIAIIFLFYGKSSKILFTIGVVICAINEITCWGCANTIVSTFQKNTQLSHNYLSAINSAWTIATFLYFPVGFLMNVESWWFFLEIMFIICIVLAILNLIFMPKVSANQYNIERSEMNLPTLSHLSAKNDLRILWNIKHLMFVWLIIAFIMITWGYFYASYGFWLKELFNLSQSEFGTIAACMEGFGNLLGILSVAYLAKSEDNNHDTDDSKDYRFSLQGLMMVSIVIGLISVLCLVLINWFSLFNEWFVFIVVGVFFMQQEAIICAGLILNVNEVPSLQQPRASAIIGIIQSGTLFVAQASLAGLYNIDGMQLESFILIAFYFFAFLCIVKLNLMMKNKKLDKELEWINSNNKGNINKYTA